MKLSIKITNLGKIVKGRVSMNRLTLFGGPNNTGKTYVSKVLYSVLRAVNSNHSRNVVGHSVGKLHGYLARDVEDRSENPVMQELAELAAIPPQYLDFFARDDDAYAGRVREIAKKVGELVPQSPNAKRAKNSKRKIELSAFRAEKVNDAVGAIKKFAEMSPESIFKSSIENTIPRLLAANFMTRRISALAASGSKGFGFDIEGVFKIETSATKPRFEYEDIGSMDGMPLVIYLDGLALKATRRLTRSIRRFNANHHVLGDFPYYHDDFLDILDLPPVVSDDFEKELEEITKSIGGRLEYTDAGIYYQEKDKSSVDISLTSSGVQQLGSLGLLIDKGLLSKNSTVFIDEPETNLHPLWQGVMVQILTELALRGINIVVATHSPYIVQHMKYAARNNKELDKIMAANHYSIDKGINGEIKKLKSNYEKLDYIQDELNETYMRTLLQGINSG